MRQLALPPHRSMLQPAPSPIICPRTHQRRPSPGGPGGISDPYLAWPQRYPGNNRALFRSRLRSYEDGADLATDRNGTIVTLELNEFELVAPAAPGGAGSATAGRQASWDGAARAAGTDGGYRG